MKLYIQLQNFYDIQIWIASNNEIMNANGNSRNTHIKHFTSNGFIYLEPEVILTQ